MPGWLVQGVRGAGKSLVAVGRALDHLRAGLPVATNMDLNIEGDPSIKGKLYRLPDQPSADDLHALGPVHDTGDETKDGLLLLDECATFLNARDWNGKARQAQVEWLVQSRKFGWSLLFIVQSADMIDKQLRSTLFDYRVTCKRLDRLRIPFVGMIGRLLTFGTWDGAFPRMHFGIVFYGSGPGATYHETWKYRGTDLFNRYRTAQVFRPAVDFGVHALWFPPPAPPSSKKVLKPKRPEVAELVKLPPSQAWAKAREMATSAAEPNAAGSGAGNQVATPAPSPWLCVDARAGRPGGPG